MQSYIDSTTLPFLDGYLFRVLVNILRSEGAEASGLYNYYEGRIEEQGRALSHYDHILFDYICEAFDRNERRFVHVGSGAGTLTSALAMAGYRIAGIERDEGRFRAATCVKSALADAWPAAMQRYDLVFGEFPTALKRTSWLAKDTVLIFTNCASSWSPTLTESIVASIRGCGDALFDARLFGKIRDSRDERDALLRQLGAAGLAATPIVTTPPDAFYHHLRPRIAA